MTQAVSNGGKGERSDVINVDKFPYLWTRAECEPLAVVVRARVRELREQQLLLLIHSCCRGISSASSS